MLQRLETRMKEPIEQFESRVMRLKHPQFMAEIWKRADVLMTEHQNILLKMADAIDQADAERDVLKKVAGKAVESARPTLNKRANAPMTFAEMRAVMLAVAHKVGSVN
jgi:hypothetical protein